MKSGAGILTNHQPLKIKPANISALTVMLCLAATIIMGGCGAKGPPEPPSGDRPPQVSDLKYSISENILKLSWTVPKTNENAKTPVTGFLIFRFQQPLFERECPNCPKIFKQVGEVPTRRAGSGQAGLAPVVFTQTLEHGYRYLYKVKAYGDGDTVSSDSNFVQFIY